ncbi:hypothetical protein [Azoarcus sp. CIB]|uniref:hypothetical protein n=1 Tax=Aromatoleum sp. (strain CIB) TaxID=198107 RepID=UPI00067C2524|nr:hypothetical protein [Azoarcus sp. CIB]
MAVEGEQRARRAFDVEALPQPRAGLVVGGGEGGAGVAAEQLERDDDAPLQRGDAGVEAVGERVGAEPAGQRGAVAGELRPVGAERAGVGEQQAAAFVVAGGEAEVAHEAGVALAQLVDAALACGDRLGEEVGQRQGVVAVGREAALAAAGGEPAQVLGGEGVEYAPFELALVRRQGGDQALPGDHGSSRMRLLCACGARRSRRSRKSISPGRKSR